MALSTLLVVFSIILMSSAAPAEDLIAGLPGLSVSLNFNQYSGYLKGTGEDRLHYWFVESGHNPSTDPLVLWLNGGPGCSSVLGLLTENGPFRIQNDGKTVMMNEYSWNKVANVIYLESPANVGFSYSPGDNYTTSDDTVSLTNYNALKSFFIKFPEFKKNDFYITGESYGGYYVPTLSVRVMQDSDINFKGAAIGNGLSSWEFNTDSLIYFAYYHGLIGDEAWNTLLMSCCSGDVRRCAFFKSSDKTCANLLNQVYTIVDNSSLNAYNLYGPCNGQTTGLQYNSTLKTAVFAYPHWRLSWSPVVAKHVQMVRGMVAEGYKVKITIPCLDTTIQVKYLNDPSVRKALNIPSNLPTWEPCNFNVTVSHKRQYASMTNQYQDILSNGKRVMVYIGDVDLACNFLGIEWFVDNLNRKVVADRKIWYYKETDGSKQVGGFVKQMEGITLLTVRGAGHMVPKDKPLPAYDIFTHFINNQPF